MLIEVATLGPSGSASARGEPAALQGCRRGNQVAVSLGLPAIGQNWRVLEPGPDAVAAGDSALVDRPRGDAVAVVHLFEGDAGFVECVLDGFGVRGWPSPDQAVRSTPR